MNYKEMDKSNTSYEDFEKACYECAKREPDVKYAYEGLDYAKSMDGIRDLYEHNTSVDSAVYLLAY